MSDIAPFRITAEELEGLDKKTLEALQPLLESLNLTLQQLVAAATLTAPTQTLSSTFNSDATGMAYVDFIPTIQRPVSMLVDQIRRVDGQGMTSVYSQSWSIVAGVGCRALFVGLDMSSQYALTVTFR